MSDIPEATPGPSVPTEDVCGTDDTIGSTGTVMGTKLDGSTIDLTLSEDGTCPSPQLPQETPQETPQEIPQPVIEKDTASLVVEESKVTGTETEMDTAEIVGEVPVVDEQLVENPNPPSIEEPLTPATDISVSKSLPGSGRVTPASQSDQSMTFSSSEKSTPARKMKVDVGGRQIEFDSLSSSSGSVKNVQFPLRAGINWRKGEKLEAMDYLDSWFPAKIRAINEEDMQVLIHFDGWNQRFDEWIDMASERIRPLIRQSERKGKRKSKGENVRGDPCLPSPEAPNKRTIKEHKIGEAVFAKWTDCKMYPAKITNVLPNGSYEVIFYDGFKKVVQPINIRSMPGEHKNKTFEINPVPEVILKKAKVKLDCTDSGERSRSKSAEMVKPEPRRDSSVEKEKKSRHKKKKQSGGVLSGGVLLPGQVDEGSMMALPSSTVIKSEPVSTQTEYAEGKVQMASIDHQVTVSGHDMVTAPLQVPVQGVPVIPPKAFVVESDHYHYKCPFDGCGKGFRKEQLLDYHIKYYHINDGGPPPPPAKRRRKTTSTCSNEVDHGTGSRKSAGKKNRNLSAECSFDQDVKWEITELHSNYSETGEISTQTSPSKHSDFYEGEDSVRPEFKVQDSMEESSVTDAEDYLKPDELVNCICDFQEENGLMIQCEVCMCWQHAACFGITERTLPKTYVCFVCENPPGVRDSSRYIHEQEWFKTGEIASFSYLPLTPMSEDRCNTVKSTHTLVAEIHQLNTVLHSLKLQLKILRTKDEAKLKQWRFDWDTMESDTMESCPNTDISGVTGTDGVKTEHTDTNNIQVKIEPPEVNDDKMEIKIENPNTKIESSEIKIEASEEKSEKSEIVTEQGEIKSDNTGDIGNEGIKAVSGEKNGVVPGENMMEATESTSGTIGSKPDPHVTGDLNGVEDSTPQTSDTTGAQSDAIGAASDSRPQTEVTGPAEIGDTSKVDQTFIKLETSSEVKQITLIGGCILVIFNNEPSERTEEGHNSDSTESVVEDPLEMCEKNLLNHILRVQGEISDRFDKIEEQIEMLEAMEAVQSRREPPTISNVLNDTPQLKQSMRYIHNDLSKVKKMSVFH